MQKHLNLQLSREKYLKYNNPNKENINEQRYNKILKMQNWFNYVLSTSNKLGIMLVDGKEPDGKEHHGPPGLDGLITSS